MHRPSRAHDVAREGGADALVAEAYAQERRGRPEAANDVGGNPGLGRRARSWRDDDVAGRERLDLVEAHLVAATDHDLLAELANVARQVVDERVPVVEEENHSFDYRFLSVDSGSLEPP